MSDKARNRLTAAAAIAGVLGMLAVLQASDPVRRSMPQDAGFGGHGPEAAGPALRQGLQEPRMTEYQ